MSSFENTSTWKRKDVTTLVYSYQSEGKQREGFSEMEPQTVSMQLQRLSVLSTTSWRVKDKEDAESEAGFATGEQISALGILDNCRLHAITLDENPNEASSRLDVTIYPAPLERLQATSVVDDLPQIGGGKRPEEGWLKDEIGRLSYHGEGEYHPDSTFSATILISHEKFDALAQDIKLGNIRSARLSLLADLYHFSYESLGAGIPGNCYNYAILCEDEGTAALWGTPKGSGGRTKARLQDLTVEWSPKLDAKMAGRRDVPDEDDDQEPGMETAERAVEKVVPLLARDVQAIRGKVDMFYQAAIWVVVLIVLSQVTSWFGW